MKPPVLPKDVRYILDILENAGHEAYIVGGCVRDFVLGIAPHDWDITTSALPAEVKRCFRHTYDTGIRHGTVTVVLHGVHYEITTYRIDGDYLDGRHPEDVTFTKNLREDLLRRDFTMNAVAYHPDRGFADPFSGIADIRAGLIRGVGAPAKRFQEDALRMLRAIRFSAQLGFAIEKATYDALLENHGLIRQISGERIREEVQKLLLCPHADRVPLLWETGLLVFDHPEPEVLVPALNRAQADPAVRWALLLQKLPLKEQKAMFARLKFDNRTAKAVQVILENQFWQPECEVVAVRRMASRLGVEWMAQLLCFLDALSVPFSREAQGVFQDVLARNDPLFLKDLALNGEALMALGIPKGKAVGETLNRLLDTVLQYPEKNTPEILRTLVKES